MTDMLQIAKSAARMVFSPESWINDQTLTSERMSRHFRLAAWAEFGILLACLFVWYSYYIVLRGGTSPLQYLSVRILIGISGAIGAFGSILLSKGMWAYWKLHDASPQRNKKVWYWIMTVFILFGASVYYHLVYRPQVEGRRLESE